MKITASSILKFVIFLGLGLLIFYFLYKNFESSYLEECAKQNIPESECSLIDKILEDFRSVKIVWLIVIVLIYMLSNIFRAKRWMQLLEPIGYKPRLINVVGSLMIGYFTNLAFPRIGEIIKTGTLSKYEDIPFEQNMGTVVVDRILDVICLLGVISLALLLSIDTFSAYFKENFVAPSQLTITILAVIGLLGLVALYFINKAFQNNQSTNPLFKKVQKAFLGFKDGLTSLKNVKNLPLLIFYSLGIWFCYYLMTYLCFWSFAPVAHLGPLAGLIVFVFGTLGMVFPSPGGMGSYHLLITQGLMMHGIDGTDAFSFSNIIFFTINIFGNIVFGLLFFLILPFYNRGHEKS